MPALPVEHERAAGGAPGRHLRVVREPRRRRPLAFLLVYLVVGATLIFTVVSLNALAAGDAVRARQLEQQVVEAERRHAQLVAEVARLEDPGRIRRVAEEQLGMVPAESPRFIVPTWLLPADGQVDDAVPAGATTDPLKPVLSQER